MKTSGPGAKTPTKSSGSPTPGTSTRSPQSAGATNADTTADPGTARLSPAQEELLEKLREKYQAWIREEDPTDPPPPTAIQFLGEREAKIVMIQDSRDRVDVVRVLAQEDPGVTAVALISDAWISELDREAECSCEGRGCEDCQGLGGALMRKREALMEMVWARGSGESALPRLRYQPYVHIGTEGRPVFEEVQAFSAPDPGGESLYGNIWREPPRREGRLQEWTGEEERV